MASSLTSLAIEIETRAIRPRRISVLGATGSIGESTLDLIGRNPGAYRVVALTGGQNVSRLAELAVLHGAELAVIAEPACYAALRTALAGTGIEVAAGDQALLEAASRPADWVMAAIVGAAGLKPTLEAVRQGTATALANKECLVSAGDIFMGEVARAGTTLLPVDSEHSAAFQAMVGTSKDRIERVCLTASGGPFRSWTLEQMKTVQPEQALNHPNWSMGPKVTIDSATLMNKGLELLEAHHLFALRPDEIDVLVHPQSVVHGLVEFRDGSVVAQLGSPDMRIPIAHCLAWPRRINGPAARLDLATVRELTFEAPDLDRFPALALARRAMESGGAASTVLNAADEVAVAEFIAGRIGFTAIAALVEATLDAAGRRDLLAEPTSIDAAMAVDHIARSLAKDLLPEIAAKAS